MYPTQQEMILGRCCDVVVAVGRDEGTKNAVLILTFKGKGCGCRVLSLLLGDVRQQRVEEAWDDTEEGRPSRGDSWDDMGGFAEWPVEQDYARV